MQLDQLRALVAVLDAGTFEGAARALAVTPSAISQRIRALEGATGRVLIRRGSPCTATEAGALVLRAARQVDLVMAEVREGLAGPTSDHAVLSVAVNADSLATWFPRVLHTAGEWGDAVLRLRVDDQQHTRRMLAGGEVLGAVTTDQQAVVGCAVQPLGVMRYLPVCAAVLGERYRDGNAMDLHRMPVVQFNAKDALQNAVLAPRGVTDAPWHEVPSSEAFARAVRGGLGWGMLPEHQIGAALETGQLVRIPGAEHQDVALSWQVWRLGSRHLERLTDAVVEASRALRPVR